MRIFRGDPRNITRAFQLEHGCCGFTQSRAMAMATIVATAMPCNHAAKGINSLELRSTSVRSEKFRHAKGSSQAGCSSCKKKKKRVAVVAGYRRHGGGGDFFVGFMLGGAVFGALGYILAPQLKKSLAGIEGAQPRYWDEDDMDIEETRKGLSEKISQLNAAIDSVSAQLRENENGVKEYELSS